MSVNADTLAAKKAQPLDEQTAKSGYSFNKETTEEQEAKFWLRNYHAALIIFLGAIPFNFIYLLATPTAPNRPAMLVLSGLVFLVTLGLMSLPIKKITRSHWRTLFFHCWTSSSIALVFLLIWLDGGTKSPTLLFLYLVLLFSCQTYTARSVLVYTCVTLLTLILMMMVQTESAGFNGTNLFLLGIIALSGGLAVGIAYIRNIQEQERADLRQKLADLASRDLMTGCLNSTAFNERLHQEIARAHREKGTLSLLLIDLDYFKDINDKYGHQEGNKALCNIADLLEKAARVTDTIGRLGGDEFAILAPNTNVKEAERLAQRLRDSLAKLECSYELTLSIGICTASCQHLWNHLQLLEIADRALYNVKRKGRNDTATCHITHPDDLANCSLMQFYVNQTST